MADPARQIDDEEYTHNVRWLRSAWDRIAQAADVLTARTHRKTRPVDVIRDATLRYVDEVLDTRDEPPRPAA
jgi:hypothetical protein